MTTRFFEGGEREVRIEEEVSPDFAMPPDIFWETQSIAFGALTTHFGLGPSIVTWDPIECGTAFRVPPQRMARWSDC